MVRNILFKQKIQKMRKIANFLIECILKIMYVIFFSIAFICNSILFVPFAFIVIILDIIIGLLCLPIAIVFLLIFILSIIARSIVDVYNFSKKYFKS